MSCDQGQVVALCLSQEKHVAKSSVEKCFFKKDFGIVGDAHGGSGMRQVSLLSKASIQKMAATGLTLAHGAFAENMVVDGIDFKEILIGTRLRVGNAVVLEVVQIGKPCHSPCSIYHSAGYCVMPKEGIFAKVLESGEVRVLDFVSIS
ncbi:MAG: MOSC domain-containing protein [Candidatus Omnitrophica bacterium]|nr:MOSC domain-containing protein [Candidatus Omnitrophota bacterium]